MCTPERLVPKGKRYVCSSSTAHVAFFYFGCTAIAYVVVLIPPKIGPSFAAWLRLRETLILRWVHIWCQIQLLRYYMVVLEELCLVESVPMLPFLTRYQANKPLLFAAVMCACASCCAFPHFLPSAFPLQVVEPMTDAHIDAQRTSTNASHS